MRKNTIRTLISVALLVVGLVLLVLISAGIDFNLEELQNPRCWLNVGIKLAITMILYNVIFALDLNNRKRDGYSKYGLAVQTKQLKLKKIKQDNLFASLDDAINAENEEMYQNECTHRLHKVTVRVDFKDLPSNLTEMEQWLKNAKDKFLLTDKDLKKLQKVVVYILNGKVKIHKIKANDILDAMGDDLIRDRQAVTFRAAHIIRLQNTVKMLTFLLSWVALTIISWKPTWTDLVFELITNLFLLGGATFSAINNSMSFLKQKTAVVENQNLLLVRRMGLTDEVTAN